MVATTPPNDVPLASLIFGDGTPRKALLTALVVGTALTGIIAGQFPPLIKVLLTYCVPYCVTTWGAVTGKRAQARRQQMSPAATPVLKDT
jgi:ABC-type uncharacterized transport system permease subunit